MDGIKGRLKAWYSEPFQTGMSVTEWFYFVGMLLVLMILWRLILKHITEEF